LGCQEELWELGSVFMRSGLGASETFEQIGFHREGQARIGIVRFVLRLGKHREKIMNSRSVETRGARSQKKSAWACHTKKE